MLSRAFRSALLLAPWVIAGAAAFSANAQAQDWTDASPALSPPARTGASFVFDPVRGNSVLFGGTGLGGGLLNDTWLWNGVSWSQVPPSPLTPSARSGHAMVFEPSTQRIIVFGGRDGTGLRSDTWTWTGTGWLPRITTTPPAARENHVMTFDAALGEVTMYGGLGATPLQNEVWSFDGVVWTQRTQLVAGPGNSTGSDVFVMNPATGRPNFISGGGPSTAGLWEWNSDPGVQAWTRLAPLPNIASGASFAASTAPNGRVVLFGRENVTGFPPVTFEWNGTAWVRRASDTTPNPGLEIDFAFDSARGRIAYFGISLMTPTPATWEFDNEARPSLVASFGAGCGSAGIALSVGSGSPIVGNTVVLRTDNAPGGGILMAVGFSDTMIGPLSLPLALDGAGLTGCSALCSLDVILPGIAAGGGFENALTIPNRRPLVGLEFFGQAYATAPGENPANLVNSNGLALRIGTF
ncbi:MAG: hypothetical protein AAF196_05595 [Planctomycetota bacterium]